jgi:hypothetical protein
VSHKTGADVNVRGENIEMLAVLKDIKDVIFSI